MNTLNIDKILKNIPAGRVNLTIFDKIDSTNEECKRINIDDSVHLIIAEEQTKGKGRLDKSWTSPNTGNIYMSFVTKLSLEKIPLSLLTGIICFRSIQSFANSDLIGLKWPNDIILSNKKIGGILIEKQIMGTEVINIIGIGLNLSLPDKESWWDDLSVFDLQNKRDEIINSIIENFLDYIDNGIQNWLEEWENACMHIDYEIKIKQNEQIIDEGKFVGINKNGSIKMISKKNNSIVSYENGDVSIGGVY